MGHGVADSKPYPPLGQFSIVNNSRINDLFVGNALCGRAEYGMFGLAWSHQVVHGVAVQKQIIGDDATMTSPPDGLGTHKCQALVVPEAKQFVERLGKFGTQCIIGIVMKRLHPPKSIQSVFDSGLLGSTPAKRGAVTVADLNRRKSLWKLLDIELWVGP